jgi:hypothetical protein
MRLSAVLSARDLPAVELQAARLDGELMMIGDCFSPIDEIEGRRHRIAALAAVLPPRLIVERRTAAWVHGAIPYPPSRHELCAPTTERSRPISPVRFTLREVVVDASDVDEIDGVRVTSPLRTVIDLARFSPASDDTLQRTIAALLVLGGNTAEDCRLMLDRRRNLPGKRQAYERILGAI